MATQAKSPNVIRIDAMVWDDPVLVALPPRTFRTYVFAIAWSKSQHGRTPDGILTQQGCSRIGATEDDLAALVKAELFVKLDDGSYEIAKYAQWQVLSSEEKLLSDKRSESGKMGAVARYGKPTPPPVEEGFDVDAAFEEAWGSWPEAHEPKYTEKRGPAYDAFRSNITNSKDFDLFGKAMMNRLRLFRSAGGPLKERRWSLGSFRTFCEDRWRDFIPKSAKVELESHVETPPSPPPAPTGEEKPWVPEF